MDTIDKEAVKATETNVAARVVEALKTALAERLVAIVLFGSRARGDATADSDWDLLVIAEGLPERTLERHFYLKRSLPRDGGECIAIIGKTPAEFEAHVPALYLDIALDGRIIYDPQDYARAKLTELRQLMDRKGLYRERTPDGDLWLWRTEPREPWSLEWEPSRAS